MDLENYDLELEKIVREIKKQKAKMILLQFPDGLKNFVTEIVDFLENKTNAEFFIWLGTCFGACDVPLEVERLDFDLIVQFGHNEMMPSY